MAIYSNGYLLKIKTEDEVVKEVMMPWARNIGYTILLESWEKIWTTNIKITKATAYKENLYKMFYRWYITPEKIAKMFPGKSNTVNVGSPMLQKGHSIIMLRSKKNTGKTYTESYKKF